MRILIIRIGQLGDTLFTSSIITPLLNHFGHDTGITWLTKPGVAEIFQFNDHIKTRCIRHRKLPIWLNWGKIACVLQSWSKPYDIIINMETGSVVNDLMRWLRAKEKIGRPYQRLNQQDLTCHAVQNNLHYLQALLPAITVEDAKPNLASPAETTNIVKQLGLTPKRYIVINPGSSHAMRGKHTMHRGWPMEYWRQLLKSLAQLEGYEIVINGAPQEAEFLQMLYPLPANAYDFSKQMTLHKLMAIINHAALLISIDTGPVHIAAALEIPIIGLFGPTDPKVTGPYPNERPIFKLIQTGLPCRPCYHTGAVKDCADNRCMKLITPEQVYSEVIAFLANTNNL